VKPPEGRKSAAAIVGPNASGKSDLGISLAGRFKAEIVSADSRQIYRGMDIGTGKISGTPDRDHLLRVETPERVFELVPLECSGILHWMLDIAEPGEPFTLAAYQALALAVMESIAARGRVPLVVGGTGLYVRALTEGLAIPPVPPDEALRAELEKMDISALLTRLRSLDPRAPDLVEVHNPRRIIRAIEILTHLGGSLAEWRKRKDLPWRFLVLGLAPSREVMKDRIHERLVRRLEEGMIDEVRRLLDRGVPPKVLDDFGLEYRFITRHLLGNLTQGKMVEELEHAIVRYAKRQMTWFRKYSSVVWLDDPAEAESQLERFLDEEP
jgi:tRNA dimethylallyltransferase